MSFGLVDQYSSFPRMASRSVLLLLSLAVLFFSRHPHLFSELVDTQESSFPREVSLLHDSLVIYWAKETRGNLDRRGSSTFSSTQESSWLMWSKVKLLSSELYYLPFRRLSTTKSSFLFPSTFPSQQSVSSLCFPSFRLQIIFSWQRNRVETEFNFFSEKVFKEKKVCCLLRNS